MGVNTWNINIRLCNKITSFRKVLGLLDKMADQINGNYRIQFENKIYKKQKLTTRKADRCTKQWESWCDK